MISEDSTIVRIVTAAYLANCLPSRPPIWMVILGEPGGGKTELLNMFDKCDRSIVRSSITPAALLSHWDKEESILNEASNGKILMLKDFATFIDGSREQVVKLMGLMRYVYDGELATSTGKGTLDFKGKLGFMSACTPAIDEYRDFITKLGERFLYVRMLPEDDDAIMDMAIKGNTYRDKYKEKLQLLMKMLVEDFKLTQGTFTPELYDETKHACRLMVGFRATFDRDRYTKEIQRAPIIERPTRVAATISRLLLCSKEIGADEEELRNILLRLLHDSLDSDRCSIMRFINQGKVRLGDVSSYLKRSKTVTKRRIDELLELGILRQDQNSYYHITSELLKEALTKWQR
jgi:hypothetical protein